jgi:hypothetical protein
VRDPTAGKLSPSLPFPFQIHIVPQEGDTVSVFKILFEDRNNTLGFLKVAATLITNIRCSFKNLELFVKEPKINDSEINEMLEILNDSLPKNFIKQPSDSFSIEIIMKSCKCITYVMVENLVSLPLMSFVKSIKFFDLTISDKLISNLLTKGSKFTSIKCLSFKKCSNITDKGISLISKTPFLRNLKTLHLSRTSITDDAFKALSYSTGENVLEEIDLSFSESVTDKGLESLLKNKSLTKNLQVLILKGCNHLTRKSLVNICKNIGKRPIRVLNLARCQKLYQEGILDLFFVVPGKILLPHTEKLNLQRTHLTDDIITYQIEFQNVTAVSFKDCDKFTDNCLKQICKGRGFKTCARLNLSGTNITDEGLKSLASSENFARIVQLKLSACKDISDEAIG